MHTHKHCVGEIIAFWWTFVLKLPKDYNFHVKRNKQSSSQWQKSIT